VGGTGPAIAGGREADPGLVFLSEVELAFERAREGAGTRRDRLDIAGVEVELGFAGDSMRDSLLPPLAHFATPGEDGEPQIRILVFDSASTGVEAPALPWRPLPTEDGGHPVNRYESEDCCVLASSATGALTAVDYSRGLAVFHLEDPEQLPLNERAAQLREALHMLLARHDRWLTHAGAVGREGGGALVVGRGGSGKSTLCIACARAGMEIAADDYVVLEHGASAIVHALPSSVKLTRESAGLLGIGPDLVAPEEFILSTELVAKASVPVERLAPGRFSTSLAVEAIVAPAVAGLETPRLERVTGASGLRSLAPSTVMQTRTRGPSALPALAKLAREAPCFRLELSTDVAANVEAVERVVRGDA
jgi:hypothetical protein